MPLGAGIRLAPLRCPGRGCLLLAYGGALGRRLGLLGCHWLGLRSRCWCGCISAGHMDMTPLCLFEVPRQQFQIPCQQVLLGLLCSAADNACDSLPLSRLRAWHLGAVLMLVAHMWQRTCRTRTASLLLKRPRSLKRPSMEDSPLLIGRASLNLVWHVVAPMSSCRHDFRSHYITLKKMCNL